MTTIKQPTGIKTLTNVAFIKYKIENKKFEIVCYKNKAINWRNGVEKDLSEVLQVDEIYDNASHGQVAKEQDFEKYFPKMSKKDIIKLILEKGIMQMGEKEREVQQSNVFNDIVNIIAEKCIHPDSNRLFSSDSIRKAILDSHIKIKQDIPPKRQALDIMKFLQQKYYMIRAQMKIAIEVQNADLNKLEKELQQLSVNKIDAILKKDTRQLICLIEPAIFRKINELIKQFFKDGSIQVLVAHVSDKEIQGIEEVGGVDLQVREEWKKQELEEKYDDQKIEEQKKMKSGKKEKKNNNKKKEEQKQKKIKDNADSDDNDYDYYCDKNNDNDFESRSALSQLQNKFTQVQLSNANNNNNNNKDMEESKQQIKSCTTCKDSSFLNMEDYRQHFKSEWHLENVKRKLKKKQILSEIEYKQYLLDTEF